MCGRSAEYANKPHILRRKSLDISAECRIPRHAAPFCTMPHYAALVPQDAAFVPQLLWQILH
jgi:hypothetical protein